jgi:DNA replication protein DnaC
LLLIDEIKYLPIDQLAPKLFFQLISRRKEPGVDRVTINQLFAAWGYVFSDHVISTAIPDGLLHHAVTPNIRGNCHRLKEKRTTGLVPTKEPRRDSWWGIFDRDT